MQTIRYRYHFAALAFASLLFWLVTIFEDAVPSGALRFFLVLGSMGFLHAVAVVIALRDRAAVEPIKAVVFVTLVTVTSIVTFMSPFLLGFFTSILDRIPGGTFGFIFVFAFTAAVGASGYWLLVRVFWLKEQKWVNLPTTVALCSCAAILCWFGAGVLTRFGAGAPTRLAGETANILPTIGWWAAFSLGLCCNDVDWNSASSKPARPEDAHP